MSTNQAKGSEGMKVVRLMLPYLGRHPLLLAAGIVGTIMGALVTFVLGIAIKNFVDGVPSDAARGFEFLNHALVVALTAAVLWALVGFATAYCLMKLSAKVMRDLRDDVFSSLIAQKVSYLERHPSGELQTRIISDTNVVGGFATGHVPSIVTSSISIVAGTLGALFISVKLTLIVLLSLPFVFLPLLLFSKKLRDFGWKTQEQTAELGTVSGEVFRSIKVVRVHNKEVAESSRFRRISEAVASIGVRSSRLQMGIGQSVNTITQCALLIVLWTAARGIYTGLHTIGELMAFAYFNGLIIAGAGTFFGLAAALEHAAGSAGRIMEYLSLEVLPPPKIAHTAPIAGAIEFRDVRFRYPSRPEVEVLKGASFAVEAGTNVVIVGASGAGKSALFELLLGLYGADSGDILVDGKDSREWSIEQLRASIGYVPQKESLVSGTVFDNIVYGAPDADEQRVMEAARLACAHEFIMQLPQGYRTNLGEVAARLSGGQRQRISLARALIRAPKILLLDEDKSALDADSERRVSDSVRKWATTRGVTVLSIAHRLSNIGRADHIVVMDAGVVVGCGRHADLLRSCDAYRTLVASYSRELGAEAHEHAPVAAPQPAAFAVAGV